MSGTLTGSGPWGLGERPYHKKNRLITISRRLPRRGCKIKIAPSNSSTAPDLGHSPLVGSEAATEVFNPAAPPFSPPYTTLSTSRPGLHAHHRSNLSNLRPRCAFLVPYDLIVTLCRFRKKAEFSVRVLCAADIKFQAGLLRVVDGVLGPAHRRSLRI